MVDKDRPAKARRLLEDPVFQEAFAGVEKAIHEKWAGTPLRDKDGAHELRLMLKLLRDVRKNIERVAQEGKSELYRSKEPTFLGDLIHGRKRIS